MRPDSPRFAESAAAGVIAGGLRVRFVGLCSTDQLYFASGLWDLPGLMVTASHSPADYNGVKVCGAGATGVSRDQGLGEIRDAAGAHRSASKMTSRWPSMTLRHATWQPRSRRRRGN